MAAFCRFLLALFITLFTLSSNALPTISSNEHVCASCHATEVKEWQKSHHFHAMEVASKQSILGDFNNSSLNYQNTRVLFITKGNAFHIEMPDEDGKLKLYKVSHTFGYHPLQQYMFDYGNGRYQFFPFAWDSRTKKEGGQRWFVLHPEQTPSDVFHWTQIGQNWNYMCADCHSTDFKKNFDLNTKQFNSSFSAINVSCNACHGDSKQHLVWASGNTSIKDKGYSKYIGTKTPLFKTEKDGRLKSVQPLKMSEQIPVCATCHARRSNLSDRKDPHDFLNAFQGALLTPELYHDDGQVWDENYVWGSFKQSKMYQAGVTCTNCHNPHSGELKLPKNQTCTQCHAATTFETSKHHGHKIDTIGSQCVDCHMPTTTYMQVDVRRDHSFKVPRPDLTLSINTPNACNSCHQDKTANWAVDNIKTWHPNSKYIGAPHFATSFYAADNRLPGADGMLTKIAQDKNFPDIIRASALSRMATMPGNNAIVAIARSVREEEPLKRLGAIEAAAPYAITDRWRMLSSLLLDPNKSVRINVANSLAAMLVQPFPNPLNQEDKRLLTEVLEEYKQTLLYQAERGFSHTNLGNLALSLNQPTQAIAHLQKAIEIEPIFMPAYINLADIYRQQGNEQKAAKVLADALIVNTESGEVHFALAMSQIRSQQKSAALLSLDKAVRYSQNNANYHYSYGLLLRDQKQANAAIKQFELAYKISPTNPDISYSLAQTYTEQGQYRLALSYAEILKRLVPNNKQVEAMVNQLKMMQSINN